MSAPVGRREVLRAGTLVMLLGTPHLAQAGRVIAVRIWPAQDYTRVTIESDAALKAHKTAVIDPPQLTVEIEGIDLLDGMRELVAKLRSDDPNIAGMRVTPVGPNLARLTIDLKKPIKPQVFNLPPVAAYQHRLVFDLFPEQEVDPLDALIRERFLEVDEASARAAKLLGIELDQAQASADPLGELIAGRNQPRPAAKPTEAPTTPRPAPGKKTERLIIVALDPGHGGEDPGAIGPGGTK